jgi:hypothetical protein
MISLKLLRAEAKRVFGPHARVSDNYKLCSDVCAHVAIAGAGIMYRQIYVDTGNQIESRALLYAALKGLPSC